MPGGWELDLSWITRELAVGGRFPDAAVPYLARELEIRRVVDVRLEARDDEIVLQQHGVLLLHLPTQDCCAVSELMIEQGVAWVGEQLDGGHRVLVHCQHGIGRSALVALCVLVSRGHAPLDALRLAKDARAQVSPSPAQLRAFLQFSASWRERHRLAWEMPSLEALGRIAYRFEE